MPTALCRQKKRLLQPVGMLREIRIVDAVMRQDEYASGAERGNKIARGARHVSLTQIVENFRYDGDVIPRSGQSAGNDQPKGSGA